MNTRANAISESPPESQVVASAVMSPVRLMYWSVRRELWENRFIYIAPVAVAGVVMLGFLIGVIGGIPELAALDPAYQPAMLVMPYGHAAWLLIVTGFIVGVFYSLDALHGERRDRSILFWKSLPVSDLTTVLAKASIPLVVLPLLVFGIIVVAHLIMLLLSTAVLLMTGVGAATLWARLPLLQMELVLLYGLTVIALWHAPIYGWLLLVSAWARRAAFLWAVLPLVAIYGIEKIAFRTSYIGSLLQYRFLGFAAVAFDLKDKGGVPVDPHFIPLTQLAPGRFLSTPGLWIGLAVAALFLAVTVRLRCYREPVWFA